MLILYVKNIHLFPDNHNIEMRDTAANPEAISCVAPEHVAVSKILSVAVFP